MKLTLAAASLALALSGAALPAAAAPNIVPYPAHMDVQDGNLALTARTVIQIPALDPDARQAATQLRDLLQRTHGLRLKIVEGDSPKAGAITFARTPTNLPAEGYALTVTPAGAIVSGSDRQGLLYGAMSLWQLSQAAPSGALTVPAVTIADSPRFRWRGLMVDSVRHFQPVDELKHLIDTMAIYKLNVLQWHLTDDQGWRLEITHYPRLTAIGAWRAPNGADGHGTKPYGGFYTQAQVRDLVAYAQTRGVSIVPEIELPGHATAALTAYPEFGTTGKVPDSGMSDWGVYSNLYSPDDTTFVFLDTVLDEVMDLFPSPYIHIGGDEAIKNQWQQSPEVQARIKALGLKDEAALQSWFVQKIGKHLSARGRHLVGWDEILDGGLAPDATVMSWRGLDGAVAATAQGHDVVLSPHPELYLDSRQSLSPDEPAGRSEMSTLRTVYDFNATPANIPPAQYSHILGLQANAFAEHMRTPKRLEEMAFPRLTALAEAAWTPQAGRDWTRYSTALPYTLAQLRQLGITYDEVPFTPTLTLSAPPQGATATLASPLAIGDIRYTLDGSAPIATSAVYGAPISTPLPSRLRTALFQGDQALGPVRTYDLSVTALNTRRSAELGTCGDSIPLRLEDDGPAKGPRALFVISIYKPCWVWTQADLSRGLTVTARIGEVPFNFQLAGGRRVVTFDTPKQSPYGELVVRLRTGTAAVCEGPTLAVLPIGRAAHQTSGLSVVSGKIPAQAGTHDLCVTFNRPGQRTLWALDQITLTPTPN